MQVCVAPSMYSIDEKSVNIIEIIFFFSLSCFIYDSKFRFTFIYLKLQMIKVTPTFASFEKKNNSIFENSLSVLLFHHLILRKRNKKKPHMNSQSSKYQMKNELCHLLGSEFIQNKCLLYISK